MVYIDESRLAGYHNTIRAHKQSLLASDQLATSLERKGGMNLEMEQVAAQVDESIFCTADLDSPCDCPRCGEAELESMAYALADYVPKVDEDHAYPDLCDDPYCNCHSDCEVNECQVCFERAQDQAENAMDAARDREMGL